MMAELLHFSVSMLDKKCLFYTKFIINFKIITKSAETATKNNNNTRKTIHGGQHQQQ